jgi:Bacteriophage HK97-gp10, putative tail-component
MPYSVSFTVVRDERKWNDQIHKLETLEMDLRKRIAGDVEKVAIDLVQKARANAHVITGNMRNSISYKSTSAGTAKVFAGVDYAVYENARGSPHDFFDQAVEAVRPNFKVIIQQGVNAVLGTKKVM